VDRSFLEDVKYTFGDWGLVPGMIAVITTTLVAAIAVALFGFWLNRIISGRRPEHKPSNWITNDNEVRNVLENALAQRAKMELSFVQSATGVSVDCSFIEMSAQALLLEAPGHLQISEDWIGRRVNCMFGLLISKQSGMVRFHVFESEILGVKRTGSDFIHLSVALPDKLIVQQKRGHLRVEPPSKCILGMALWPEILDDAYSPETRIKKWGPPLAKYIRGETNPIRAVNFSAGGLRLELDPEVVRASDSNFEIGEHYFLLVDLLEPKNGEKKRFWLHLKVRNRYEDYHTKKLGVGFQIISRAELKDKEKGLIEWRDVPRDGLDSLGNWTVQRHLELFREKGVAP
jgi:hypothetical protein